MKLASFVCVALLAVLLQAEHEVAPPGDRAGSRVANSRPAAPRQFPFTAYVESYLDSGELDWRCAGSLVTRSAVLTSASPCVYYGSKWTVRLGSIYRTGDDPNAWSVESVIAMIHPKYNNESRDNDIGIIHLPRLAPVNEFIQPVSLARSPADSSYVGCQAIVAGWGRTHSGSGPSDVLRWAEVIIVPNHYCKQFRPAMAVTDRQLCAGSYNTTAQHNDWGGPLVLNIRGRYTQIGLFSIVTNYTFNTPHPAIYTRVTPHIDWIKLNTESD